MAAGSGPGSKRRELLIVEDDHRLADGMQTLLAAAGWGVLVASQGEQAVQLLQSRAQSVAVALVDLGLPDVDGITLVSRLHAGWPQVPIVVLTICTDERRILAAIQAGACGYLFKDEVGSGLQGALDEVLAGGAPMSHPVARLVLEQLRGVHRSTLPASGDPVPEMTDRERDVLQALARGLSYDQVAAVLNISTNTVRTYVRTIYEKLSVRSKTEAVVAAMKLGLVRGGL